MEMHQLRYFVEVVRRRNFTRAAEACHVTQPTLSHQIRKLEDTLGEPLLQRRRNGAFPTPLGERLYPRAVRILEESESARREAQSFADAVQGELRIGVIPTIAPYFLPGVLRLGKERHPLLRFRIAERPTGDLLRELRNGGLDAAILSPPVDGTDLRVRDLFEDPFLLALPRKHPLAKSDPLDLHRVAEQPFILLDEAHCLRGQAINLCNRADFEPEVLIESAQLDTVVALVESGLGISIVPAIARRAFAHRKVHLRSLLPEHLRRVISLAWPVQAAETRAFAAFLKLCDKAAATVRGDIDD